MAAIGGFVRPTENERGPLDLATGNSAATFTPAGGLVWLAFALGLASAVPGMVLGMFGLPLGVAAAAVSVIALLRLTDKPPEERRGEMLTMLGLGFGVFQIVFALVAFYFVNAG